MWRSFLGPRSTPTTSWSRWSELTALFAACTLCAAVSGCRDEPTSPSAPDGGAAVDAGGAASAVKAPAALPALPSRPSPVLRRQQASGVERIFPLEFGGAIEAATALEGGVLIGTSDGELALTRDGVGFEARGRLEQPILSLASGRSPAGAEVVVAVMADATVQWSEDGGRTFRAIGPALPVRVESDPVVATIRRALSAVAVRWVGSGWTIVVSGVAAWSAVSQDGGATWKTDALGEDGEIHDIHIGGDGQVLMCGTRGQVFHLGLDGTGWKGLRVPDKPPVQACELTDASRGEVVAVGAQGLAASGGLSGSWKMLSATGVSLSDLALEGRTLWGVGPEGAIVRSGDGGRRWTVVARFEGASFDRMVWQDKVGLAIGRHAVARTVDGGRTWAWVRGEQVSEVLAIDGVGNGHAVASGLRGRVWMIGPDGVRAVASGSTASLPSVSVASGKFVWAGTDDGRVLRSEDAGGTFDGGVSPGEVSRVSAVHALDALNVFAAGLGQLFVSVDRGKSWRSMTIDGDSRGAELLALAEDRSDAQTRLWAVGDAGTVLVSERGAQRMRAHRYGGAGAFSDVEAVDGQVFLLDSAGLLVRTDGREPLALEVLAVPAAFAVTRMAFAGDGTGLMLATSGALLRTEDGGRRWFLVELDLDAIVNDLIVVDGAYLMVGHGGVARRSVDGGQTFERIQTGTGKSLNALALVDGEVVAGGFNGVAVRSGDGGRTWSKWDVLPPSMDAMHITAMGSDGAQVAVGGAGELWVREGGGWSRVVPEAEAEKLGEVRRIVFGGGGQIFLHSSNGGVWRRDGGVLTTLEFAGANAEPVGTITDLVGAGGRIFASAAGGVFEVRSAGDSTPPATSSERVTLFPVARPTTAPIVRLVAQDGRLWLGGPGGVWAMEGLESARQVLPTLGVGCHDMAFTDRSRGFVGCDDGVLMATRDGGETFEAIWLGTWSSLQAVHIESDGVVEAGTRAGGLYRWRP